MGRETNKQDMIMKNKDKILEFVCTATKLSDDYLETKKNTIEQRYRNYRRYNPNPTENKMKDNTVFNIIDLYLAVDHYEGSGIKFTAKNNTAKSKEVAQYVTQLFESDYEAGEIKKEEMSLAFQKYFTGIGVMFRVGWDKYKQRPIFRAVPTLNLIIDPEGGNDIRDWRFVGARMRYSVNNMRDPKGGWIIPAVSATNNSKKDTKQKEVDQAVRSIAGYQDVSNSHLGKKLENDEKEESIKSKESETKEANKSISQNIGYVDAIDVYAKFHMVGEEKAKVYLFTISQDKNLLLRVKEIEPKTEQEREDPLKVKFPVNIDRYLDTVQGDPIGMSVFDLVEEKQINRSALLNLATAKGIKNLNAVLAVREGVDLNDVNPSSDKVVTIPNEAGTRDPLSNYVQFLEKEDIKMTDVLNLLKAIEYEVSKSTATNTNLFGVGTNEPTAAQTDAVQANSNVRHRKRLMQHMDKYKKDFALNWFDAYRRYYSPSKKSKKNIIINTGITSMDHFIEKNYFKGDTMRVEAESIYVKKSKDNQERVGLIEMYKILAPGFANDAQAGKKYQRKLLELQGLSHQTIESIIPKTKLEVEIEAENELLVNDIEIPISPNIDIESRFPTQMNIPTDAGRKRARDLTNMAIIMGISDKIENEVQESITQEQATKAPDPYIRAGKDESATETAPAKETPEELVVNDT